MEVDAIQSKPVRSRGVQLAKKILDMNDNDLHAHIHSVSFDFYHDEPKPLQVQSVSALARGEHCFVRAGTGYGKTRISEMYFKLFMTKVIVLVLNPLDSLGDDQVREKKLVNISAVNLNKMSCNREVIRKIKKGLYSFVYLSPEVFLNSTLFTDMFFSEQFQKKLALIVIDEAHMIYLWGLVASRQAKSLNSFDRHDDRGVFRISYGHMGTRLMATKNVPLLLLSATCRPVAVQSILNNLLLQPGDITMLNGELTRQEIRIIRIPMQSTLSSCHDLLRFFAPKAKIPAKDAVPMIIYSGSRNLTFQVMKVVNEARNTRHHEYDPTDEFIRRFHAVTSEKDKADNLQDFSNGKFPVMSATMALGLGRNLKRVRCVIHMGRGDPSSIVQMIGRCGRDGKPGLAFLFMEPTRAKGLNDVQSFDPALPQDDDARMDALAISPLCLRVALSVDNKHGYIPLDATDPNFVAERVREVTGSFDVCKCSNCLPDEAEAIIDRVQQMTLDNFDDFLKDPLSIIKDTEVTNSKQQNNSYSKGTCSYPPEVAAHLVDHLEKNFLAFFNTLPGSDTGELLGSDFFDVATAKKLVASIDQVVASEGQARKRLLERLVGGQFFPGQVDWIDGCLNAWVSGEYYQDHLRRIKLHEEFVDSEILRYRNEREARQRQAIVDHQADLCRRKELRQAASSSRAEAKALQSQIDGAARTQAKQLSLAQAAKKIQAQLEASSQKAEQTRRAREEEERKAVAKQEAQAQRAARAELRQFQDDKDAASKAAKRARKALLKESERQAKALASKEAKLARKESIASKKEKALANQALRDMKSKKQKEIKVGDALALAEFKKSMGQAPEMSPAPSALEDEHMDVE